MRKSFLILSIFAALSVSARTIYLDTGGSELWNKDGASFYIHSWGGVAESDRQMSSVSDDVFKVDIPDDNKSVIFVRMPGGSGTLDWSKAWNKTDDLTIEGDNNLYTITGWNPGDGVWSVYGQGGGDNPGGGDTPGGGGEIPAGEDFDSAVPAQCTDVILQGFYWKSNVNSGYGDTKWETLYGQVSEISKSFTMVWLPPSAQASGISAGGLGYIPLIYSSQSCLMGKRASLEKLISAFHNNGVRVMADIVINHIGNPEGDCKLESVNFGKFGSFTPNKDWLTSNDEGNCGSSGNQDDGQHDANYPSARDWDHKNKQVQNMCKAYLKWMKAEMKYDGFRYDYVGGFHVSHINDYNTASKPYFSVIEYWLGDANVLKQRIDEAGKNTLAFDFAAKYTAFRDGIFNKNYNNCKSAGLRGKGYSKYAVTFIDNHDTFNRGSENEDVANKRDGSSINDKSLMMRCNAYLLSMPGVPCVFYPHWVKYKSEIQKMITARRMAGIHSESAITENSGTDWYEATVQGKYGSVILYLGSSASKAAPQGYKEAIKGADYAMYYTGDGPQDGGQPGGEQAVENITRDSQQSSLVTKIFRDGQLYILRDGSIYTVTGTKIK